MRILLNDDVQLIKLSPGVPLTPVRINQALQRASSNRMYAKFYTSKYFIQVNFARDGNISVASNIRNPSFINDLWRKNRDGWTIPIVQNFLYQWLNLSRRLMY